ncbi:MAG: hypothetical protein K2M82_06165 [Lachnospiraceae bacterium]|nr:hypothetical protein [Lachnospiraceae bacterium]
MKNLERNSDTSFQNEVFTTLDKAVNRLCDKICSLTADTTKSITVRD